METVWVWDPATTTRGRGALVLGEPEKYAWMPHPSRPRATAFFAPAARDRYYQTTLNVSPNYKILSNSFHPLHFPVSRSNDKTVVLYLDSNLNVCYHSLCLSRQSPAKHSPR